jgi:hypothetical protein
MAVLPSAFSPVVIAKAPSWSRRSGMVIKRYHFPNSGYQNLAQAQFGDAASQAFGRRGFVGGLPVVAAHVRAAVSGHSVGGGQASAQRRMEDHQSVGARMSALRQRGQSKIGVGGGGGMLPF